MTRIITAAAIALAALAAGVTPAQPAPTKDAPRVTGELTRRGYPRPGLELVFTQKYTRDPLDTERVVNPATLTSYTTTTDRRGRFELRLPAGYYDVDVNDAGCATCTVTPSIVLVDGRTRLALVEAPTR